MNRHVAVLAIVLLLILSAGCGKNVESNTGSMEVSTYDKKILKVDNELKLSLDVQCGNVQIYSWDKKEIRFEITKKLKGSASRKVSEDKLENFKIDLEQQDNTINFSSKYPGKMDNNKSIDLVIYVPRKIVDLSCSMEYGSIRFLDDIRCSFKAQVNEALLDINNFEGKIDVALNEGNLRIGNGKISGNSIIKVNKGNIDIKAQLDETGSFDLKTSFGNINLELPYNLKAGFSCFGTTNINEFTDNSYPIRVKACSDIGRVTIKKFTGI